MVEQLRVSFEKAESLIHNKNVPRRVEVAEEGVAKRRVKKAIASNLGYGEGSIRI